MGGIVITGGRVVDPASGMDAIGDVAFPFGSGAMRAAPRADQLTAGKRTITSPSHTRSPLSTVLFAMEQPAREPGNRGLRR